MKWLPVAITALLLVAQINSSAQEAGTAYSSDSAPVYYRVYGSGKPLLVINGGPGMNSNGFEGLAKALSKNNMVIIYDQRGTGRSVLKKTDASTVTLQLMMDDVEALRKELKIEKWSILGHSFGGMLASYYATKYPQHIEKLILSSSGGIDLGLLNDVNASINSKLSKAQHDSLSYWNNRINGGDTTHYAALQRGLNLAHAYVLDQKYIPVIGERLTQGNSALNSLIWADLQKNRFDCSAGLKNFDQPVLIIQGREDIIRPETAEKAHRVLKNSRIVYLDHSIHYGWLDNPESFFAALNSFLADGRP